MGRSFNAMAERVRAMIMGQKELMAGVSHELRSPLARMKVSLELLREGKGGAGRIADLEADVDALDSLVEKGFCAQGSDSVNRYRPIQPRIAIEAKVGELKRKEDEARALANDLEVLLLAGQGQELWAPPIEIVKGTRVVSQWR